MFLDCINIDVYINPRVLSANRVDLGFFCFIHFPIFSPPPSPGPLHDAAATGDLEEVKRLLDAGFDPQESDGGWGGGGGSVCKTKGGIFMSKINNKR